MALFEIQELSGLPFAWRVVATIVGFIVVFMAIWVRPVKPEDPPEKPPLIVNTTGNNSPAYAAGRDMIVNQLSSENPEPAFVFLDPAGALDLSIEVGKPPSAMVHFKNSGRSTAFELLAAVRMAIGDGDLPSDFTYPASPKMGQPPVVCIPGETSHWGAGDPNDPPITEEQFEALKNGSLNFIVYGRVTYKDSLGNNRWTNFCLRLTPPSNPHSKSFAVQKYGPHNDSDVIGRL